VQVYQLSEENLNLDIHDKQAVQQEVHVEIQKLLHTYADIFATQVSFSPPRPYFHSIPLIPGCKPVQIWPYRYTPLLKDKIEKKVHDMLEACLIQHSNCPFSSPVLLVKKKDKTYMFCVDYRYLNAITMKGQYPVPIIEELLQKICEKFWGDCKAFD
jgi:hypothetical protein